MSFPHELQLLASEIVVDVPEQIRCFFCNKWLCKLLKRGTGRIEIKCPKCSKYNIIELDRGQQRAR